MHRCLSVLILFLVFSAVQSQIKPNNTYNVPLLDFGPHPVNKSLLCSTPNCCPIALTFDDGPDGARGVSDVIIDYLHSHNISSTFFMNSKNWVDVDMNPVAQKTVKNIVQFGFNLGTHTVHHKDLTNLSDADIKYEITGVQTTVDKFMSASPRLSLFRAPFGNPYNTATQVQMDIVSKIAADAGYLHVAWQIDPSDYACGNNITCVTDPIFRAVDEGQWGIIILHFIHNNTANALPSLIAGLRQRRCEFFTVEQFVQAKYGQSSADVMDDYNRKSNATFTSPSTFIMIIFTFYIVFLYFSK